MRDAATSTDDDGVGIPTGRPDPRARGRGPTGAGMSAEAAEMAAAAAAFLPHNLQQLDLNEQTALAVRMQQWLMALVRFVCLVVPVWFVNLLFHLKTSKGC